MVEIDIHVRKAGYVDDARIDEAVNALNSLESQIGHTFNITKTKASSDNLQSEIDCYSRLNTIRNVEDALYADRTLHNNDLIVPIHDCGDPTGQDMAVAGINFWPIGATNASVYIEGQQRDRLYESECGPYAVSFANATTRHTPYNKDYFLNTVIHESSHGMMDGVGSGEHAEHEQGGIYYSDEASPMCTWYVESSESIYVSNDDIEGDNLCIYRGDWDNTGHDQNVTSCTVTEIDQHIDYWY